jgi:hypothetical protein
MFLSRAQTQNFLQSDADGFSQRLSPLDLAARHVKSRSEYIDKAVKSAQEFTAEEKDSIWREVTRADEYLAGTRYGGIPWRLAKAQYEEGLPHTRGPIIFVPGTVDAATLTHEMVHVVQKMRGPKIPPGYVQSRATFQNMRANPDTDGKVWFMGTTPADSFYKSKVPMGISDVVQYIEHPFEAEAYAVSDAFRPNTQWNA